MRAANQSRWNDNATDDREPRRTRRRRTKTEGQNNTLLYVFGGLGLSFALLIGLLFAGAVMVAALDMEGRGKRIELNGGSELYYKKSVSEPEARKLADFLNEVVTKPNSAGYAGSFQIAKEEDTYILRVCVKEGAEKDKGTEFAWTVMGTAISAKVFDKAPIQVVFVDKNLNTVYALPRVDLSKTNKPDEKKEKNEKK